jgi:hypothetical protein
VYAALVALVAEAFVIVSAGIVGTIASPCSFSPCIEEPNPLVYFVAPASVVGVLLWLGFLAIAEDVLPNDGARWFGGIGIFVGWTALLGAAAERVAARVPTA